MTAPADLARGVAAPCALADLLDALEWSDRLAALSHDDLDAVRDLCERRIEAARAHGHDEAGAVAAALAQLPDDARARILRAPESRHRLGDADDARLLGFLHGAVLAERAIAGEPTPVPCWTALGDRYFPAGAAGEPDQIGGDFDPARPYAAPALGAIVVDHASPYAAAVYGPDGFREEAPTTAEAAAVHRKLVDAAALIADLGAGVAAFVDGALATLVLRCERASVATGSSTAPEHPGRAVIWNAHRDSVDVDELAEQLVHESIHCHAYRLERRIPLAPIPAPTDRPTSAAQVTSPWSARSLTVHGYVHACFVWFGLTHLWLLALAGDRWPVRAAFARLYLAARGFAVDLVAPLDDAPGATAAARAAIAEMQRRIRQRAVADPWLARLGPAIGLAP